MFRTYLWSLSVVFNYYIVGLTIPHMKVLQPAYLLHRLSLLSKKIGQSIVGVEFAKRETKS